MARKYFYFDLDYYGVGFCEEEITVEAEQMAAVSVDVGCYAERAAGTQPEPGIENYLSPVGDDNYKKCDMSNTQGSHQKPEEEELEKAKDMVSEQPYKFTPGQLWELQTVFQETQYPDALRQKELAEVMNVDEQNVKDWFNNSRANLGKLRRE